MIKRLEVRADNSLPNEYKNTPLPIKAAPDRKGILIPGDIVRFVNPEGIANYKNENSVYLGKDPLRSGPDELFFAAGLEIEGSIATKDSILEALNDRYRVKGATERATLDDTPFYIDISSLPSK
jgi:hypothetical protein